MNHPLHPGRRVYLSGPMTGLPELNFPAFQAWHRHLLVLGLQVVNPAELNPDPATSWHDCMRRDLAELLTCDTLALLPGWTRSQGAHLEMHVAHRVGMHIVVATEVWGDDGRGLPPPYVPAVCRRQPDSDPLGVAPRRRRSDWPEIGTEEAAT